MLKWIQPFTCLNPIAHFAGLARGVLVRGSGLEGFSAWKFRGQMS